MSRHLCFYNNDTLLQDNSEPGYFTEFIVPADTNLIVCYDDDYKITCNIRVTASSNQDLINYQFSTDSAIFLLRSLQNYTQNQSVRAQITVSNIAKDSNNLAQDIQNYLQNCGVSSGTSIDFSTIVTALNNITTALSALTNLSNLSNLSNLADLANLVGLSQFFDDFKQIFSYKDTLGRYRSGVHGVLLGGFTNNATTRNICSQIMRLSSVLTSDVQSIDSEINSTNFSIDKKLLAKIFASLTDRVEGSASLTDVSAHSKLNAIGDIETKLEQNLPFTTIVDNEIVETNVAQNCSYGSKIEQIPFSE